MNIGSIRTTRTRLRNAVATVCAVVALLAVSRPAAGSQIWTGPLLYFTNFSSADVDMITPSVGITRGATRGLYNVVAENHYTHSLSPVGTEWGFGEVTNIGAINFSNWEDWFGGAAGGGPTSTVGKDAVLHIIPEDIYIGIKFLSWNMGSGGFVYARTTSSLVPEPGSAAIVAVGAVGGAIYRRKRRKRTSNFT